MPLRGLWVPILAALAIIAVSVSVKAQQPTLKEWFNALKSPAGGVCCHNFDGVSLDEAEWRTAGNRYQVKVEGKWIDVPPDTVVTEPNRLGRAHLWLKFDGSVRCFIAGTLS